MTVLLPAWLQTGAYTAEHDRFVGTALLNPGTALSGRGGVRRVFGDEFAVSATSPVSMAIQVSPGMAFVQGSYTVTQGVYTVVNDGFFQLSINPAHSTLPRIDRIVLEILDQTYAGTSNLAQVRVVTGTASASPVPAATTGSFIVLGQVLVPPSATSILGTNITDLRPFTTALGAPIPVRNVAERNAIVGKYDGLQVLMMDNAYELHTYAGGEWYGSSARYFGVTAIAYVTNNPVDYTIRTLVDRAKITDPGFRYMLRLDMSVEHLGAKVNGLVYCESTTTTSVSNEVAAGQTLDWNSINGAGATDSIDRLSINRAFTTSYTGNRWVTMRVQKDAREASNYGYTLTSNKSFFQVTMDPVRPAGFITATSVGGQP